MVIKICLLILSIILIAFVCYVDFMFKKIVKLSGDFLEITEAHIRTILKNRDEIRDLKNSISLTDTGVSIVYQTLKEHIDETNIRKSKKRTR